MFKNINIEELHPLHPEIISKQATINIGTIGHVAHGKSTVVRAISGVQTVRFKNELERNITIKLGYANAKIYECDNPECPSPGRYKSYKSDKESHTPCERPGCGGTMNLIRHISLVDCPGHDILMATMLNGAAVMDAALLLIAGNEPCPQPQTLEHLAAIDIMGLKHTIILQNKIDLVKKDVAEEQYDAICSFIEGTAAKNAPIIPVSGQFKYNIDAVCEAIVKTIPIPTRDFSSDPKMIVIRSFDINKPGASINELYGGVAGGSILTGVLRVGDKIELRPGIVSKKSNGQLAYKPILTVIMSLYAENNDLQIAVPGGLVGVGTLIDPTFCRADRLVGQVLGYRDKLPLVYNEIHVCYHLLRCLVGVKSNSTVSPSKIHKLEVGEILMINIGSRSTGGHIISINHGFMVLKLNMPACTNVDEKIAISRRIDNNWRLIGWGSICGGKAIQVK